MKTIRTLGLGLILSSICLFMSLLFMGQYKLTSAAFEDFITQNNITSSVFIKDLKNSSVDKEFSTPFYLANSIAKAVESANALSQRKQRMGTSHLDKTTQFGLSNGEIFWDRYCG